MRTLTHWLPHTRRAALVFGLLALAGLILPAIVAAQACQGVPIGRGQFGLAGAIGFTDGAQSYGVDFTGNLPGPVTASVGYALADYEDVDPNSHAFSGQVGYELSVPDVSICPGIGGSYTRISESVSTVIGNITGKITQTTGGVGLGVGRTFTSDTGDVGVTLFAIPRFFLVHTSADVFTETVPAGVITVTETDDRGEFGMDAGVKLDVGAVFFGGSVSFTTTEDSDPNFYVGIGVTLGSER